MASVHSKIPCIVYRNHFNRFRPKYIAEFSLFLQAMPLQRRRESIINKTKTHDGNRSLIQDEKHRTDNLKERFIGAIDQGTSSTRFIIFDATGVPVASHQCEFKQIHEHSGWHEQDPKELLGTTETCIEEAMKAFQKKGYSKSDLECIGITNQRETIVVWDWETGEPLHNAIAWPDTRTKGLVREFRAKPGAENLINVCGLPLSTYPTAVRLVWLLRHREKVKRAYDEGRLAFGTVDSWLLYHLNGGPKSKFHLTDATNASRTMFVNLRTLEYDNELLDFFGLDRNKVRLPRIVPSADPIEFGQVEVGPLQGTPIASCLGDQSAALVGHCAFSPGTTKNTYGTGCFLLQNVGPEPVISKHGLLATVAFQLGAKRQPIYALEGSIAVAGSGISFLMNNLGFCRDSRRVSEIAASVPDSGGLVFVTAFSGLFAPYWIDDAKGTICE
ncbi:hypothetical protein VTN31DRAFT_6017 [Thermomyces dupontii]|uniref:uncharacterized protein n=1 Tax=Talaromyces thermophilus TaxID=28565 RepID=UPI003744A744